MAAVLGISGEYHDAAAAILANAARDPAYQQQLQALVESLATRTS